MLKFWRDLVHPLVGRQPTPFYVFSVVPIREALAEIQTQFGHLPVRPWLSCKTQPLRPLLRWWQEQGLGIEVVSEFEFCAALKEGFPATRILLNPIVLTIVNNYNRIIFFPGLIDLSGERLGVVNSFQAHVKRCTRSSLQLEALTQAISRHPGNFLANTYQRPATGRPSRQLVIDHEIRDLLGAPVAIPIG